MKSFIQKDRVTLLVHKKIRSIISGSGFTNYSKYFSYFLMNLLEALNSLS